MSGPGITVGPGGVAAPSQQAALVAAPNSIAPGRLDTSAWNWYPGQGVQVRNIAADSIATPYADARSLVSVNPDGRAIPDGGLQLPVTLPTDGGTAYQIHLDEVGILTGSTGAFALELYDSTGLVAGRVTSQQFTPTTTSTSVRTTTVTLVAGAEYILRINCNPGGAGQSSFLCGALRLVPMAPTSSAWSNPYSSPAGAGFVLYPLDTPRWADSNEPMGRDNPRWARRSEAAHVDLQTNAATLKIVAYDNAGDSSLAPHDALSLLVDGYALDPPLTPTISATSYLTVTMPAATTSAQMRAVSIVDGAQTGTGLPTPVLEPRGSFPLGVIVPAGAVVQFVPPTLRTVVNYGDSKFAEFYSSIPNRDAYNAQMRARGIRVVQEAYGGRSLSADVGTVASANAPQLLTFARKLLRTSPQQINFGIGRNDFTGNTYGSTAALITQMQNLIRALHALSPGTVIAICTWSSETTETTADVTWNAARASMAAIVTTAEFSSYCILYDLARLWTPAEGPTYTYDGVHPNDLGQGAIAQVMSGGPWPWKPTRTVAPCVGWWEPSIAASYQGATATVTSSGTSPPTMTITGTPAAGLRNLRIECLVGGAYGTSKIRWTTDGDGLGRHWDSANGGVSEALIPTAAAIVLGSTGLAANFAATSFANDNVWLVVLNCSALSDLSGAGNTMAQTTDAFRPKFVPNADAQYPTLGPAVAIPGMFFTPNNLLHKGGLSLTTYTLVVVAKAADAGSRAIFGSGPAGSAAPVCYTNGTSFIVNDGTRQVTNTNATPTVMSTYVVVVNGASSNVRVNGIDQTGTLSETLTDLSWGYDYTNSIAFSGGSPLALLFNGAHTAADILAVEAYCRYSYQPGGPTGSGYAAAAVTSVAGVSPIASTGGSTPAISIQASSGSQAGSMSAAQATQLAALPATFAAGFFELDVTLTGGTATVASGKDLTNAKAISIRLITPTTATGSPIVTFVAGANGNVTVTSYTAGAVQVSLDASKYRVEFVGAV